MTEKRRALLRPGDSGGAEEEEMATRIMLRISIDRMPGTVTMETDSHAQGVRIIEGEPTPQELALFARVVKRDLPQWCEDIHSRHMSISFGNEA